MGADKAAHIRMYPSSQPSVGNLVYMSPQKERSTYGIQTIVFSIDNLLHNILCLFPVFARELSTRLFGGVDSLYGWDYYQNTMQTSKAYNLLGLALATTIGGAFARVRFSL